MPDEPASRPEAQRRATSRQRLILLLRLRRWLEAPMALLGFAWLALLVVDLLRGLTPLLEGLVNVIWGLFVVDFAVQLLLAPAKLAYLRRHWLTALSLLAPALRMLRIVRIARGLRTLRMARGLRLLRIVSSVNRGLKALGRHMSRRGFPYVLSLSLVVTLAGSAGMYAFEHDPAAPHLGLPDYGSALWWTAMIVTTMGSDYWPRTPEGRILCFLLALYSFAVFGYVTAALASFFVGRDAENPPSPRREDVRLDTLLSEMAALRTAMAQQRGAATAAAGPSRRRASRPRRPR